MAREASITQEQVSAAADKLVASGVKPTNRAVLEALGSGSMATIVSYMQVWKQGQERRSEGIDDTIDPSVAGSISNMVARRVQEATAEANARLVELQSDLAQVIAENERQTAELEDQAVDLIKLRSQVQAQSGQIEQLLADATLAREQIAAETKSREAAQISLAKAELRIESLPALLEELKTLRLEAKRSGEEAAELRGQLVGRDSTKK
jgi:phage shock protein A